MNKVIILGNITKDLEVKTTSTGKSVLRFCVAVQGKSKEAQTDFIDCVAWEKNAENIAKFFSKGRKILVEGELKTGSYQKSEISIKTTEVWVNGFDFVDKKNDTSSKPLFEMKEPKINDDDIPF